jgi:hypothetical protein
MDPRHLNMVFISGPESSQPFSRCHIQHFMWWTARQERETRTVVGRNHAIFPSYQKINGFFDKSIFLLWATHWQFNYQPRNVKLLVTRLKKSTQEVSKNIYNTSTPKKSIYSQTTPWLGSYKCVSLVTGLQIILPLSKMLNQSGNTWSHIYGNTKTILHVKSLIPRQLLCLP